MKPNKRDIRKPELLEKCFECFCKNGIAETSTKMLSNACGFSAGNIFHYFEGKDQIIIESTAYCMAKVEEDFMAKAPKSFEEIESYIKEIPYWTAKKHGEKYRFMYQVYTSPKYLEHGKKFVNGITERYGEYAKELSPMLGIPVETVKAFIYIFVRASVHYAIFEDESYLKPQIDVLLQMIETYKKQGKA